MKWLQLILSFSAVIGGVALCFCALYMEKEGEIDPTVLVAYGETLTFAGAVIGVDYHYKYKSDK